MGCLVPEVYDGETEDQLEARFRAGEGMADAQPQEPVAVEPEPPETPADSQQAEETPPAPSDPDPGDVTPEPEFDEREYALEEMRLKLEKTEADNRRIELERGRATGEMGHLRKQLRDLQVHLTQPQPNQDDYAEPTGRRLSEPILPGPSVDQSRLAELENDARAGAISAEYQDFLASRGIRPEDANGLIQHLAPSIQEQWGPYRESLAEMSARSVRKVLRTVLDSAYADFRLRELQAKASEARQRKASQVPEVRKAKLAAGVAGSGGASPPAPRPKRPDELTAEEADLELTRQFGRRRGR